MLPKCRDVYRGPGRPRRIDPGERETIILDAAERLIMAQGLAGASMAAIAHEAGMSKRTLYEVFEGRAALFAAIIRRIRTTMTRPLSGEDLQLPLDERLRRLLTPSRDKLQSPVPIAILRAVVAEADRQPDLAREFLQEGPHAMNEMIRIELDRAVERGELAIGDTHAAARLMVDMAHDGVLEHLVSPRPAPGYEEIAARRLDLALTVFLRGIEATA